MKKEKAIEGGAHGCGNCGNTESILSLDTYLYQGFGGYHVTVNGELIYKAEMMPEDATDFSYCKQLADIEKEIQEYEEKCKDFDIRCHVDLPLRSAVWQRQGIDKWVLIEKGNGFA